MINENNKTNTRKLQRALENIENLKLKSSNTNAIINKTNTNSKLIKSSQNTYNNLNLLKK